MSEVQQKKKRKQTYYLMRKVLESQDIKISVKNLPSDQFILKNLPDSVRQITGAAKPAKIALAATAIAVTAVIASIVTPAVVLFAGLSITAGLVGAGLGFATAGISYLVASKKMKEIKQKYAADIAKHLMAKHIVYKAGSLKQSWKNNRDKRKEEQQAAKAKRAIDALIQQAEKPDSDNTDAVVKAGSMFSGALRVKEAWDKSVTDDSKKKLQDGLVSAKDAAKDAASDAVQGTKKKLGRMFRNFRKPKSPGNN